MHKQHRQAHVARPLTHACMETRKIVCNRVTTNSVLEFEHSLNCRSVYRWDLTVSHHTTHRLDLRLLEKYSHRLGQEQTYIWRAKNKKTRDTVSFLPAHTRILETGENITCACVWTELCTRYKTSEKNLKKTTINRVLTKQLLKHLFV